MNRSNPTDTPPTPRKTRLVIPNDEGQTIELAERFTERGDLMHANIHYHPHKTSAQSPSHAARRLLYAHKHNQERNIRSCDVPNTYLRAPTDPKFEVLMTQLRRSDNTYTGLGCEVKLSRAQMGVPNAGFVWEKQSRARLTYICFKPLLAEPGCYIFQNAESNNWARFLFHTDVFLLTSTCNKLLDKLMIRLQNERNVKEQKSFQQYNGIGIRGHNGCVTLSLKKNIEQLLRLLKVSTFNEVTTPHNPELTYQWEICTKSH